MMEETKGMVMSLQSQIDVIEALKQGKFPELPDPVQVKLDVLEPVVKVVEVIGADSLYLVCRKHVWPCVTFSLFSEKPLMYNLS